MATVPSQLPVVALLEPDATNGEALRQTLSAQGFDTRLYSSAEKFLGEAPWEKTQCLIVADELLGMSTLQYWSRLRDRGAVPPVILVTARAELAAFASAIKLESCDIVSRTNAKTELPERIRAVIQLRTKRCDLAKQAASAQERLARLSSREKEVLNLVIQAKSNKEIAHELSVSPRTIENHRARILKKLEAGSAMALLRLTLTSKGIPLS